MRRRDLNRVGRAVLVGVTGFGVCGFDPAAALGDDPPRPAGGSAVSSAQADVPLVHEAIIDAPIERVWPVLSTAEGYTAWGVAKCDVDFRVGGEIRSHYKPDGDLHGESAIVQEILAFEPGRMLAVRVKSVPKGFPFPEDVWKKTWSVFTLTDLGDGRTHVRIAGCGYDDRPESQSMRQFFKAGNEFSLKTLKANLESKAEKPDMNQAHEQGPLSPIEVVRVVDAPRADVWKALTTGEGWKSFLQVDNKIELRPGGPLELYFMPDAPEGGRGSEGCMFLSYVPQEMVSFTWNAPPTLPHARGERTWVVIRLEQISPAQTRVRLDHLGFAEKAAEFPDHKAEWEQTRAYFARAWPMVVGALDNHFRPEAVEDAGSESK